MLCKHNDHLALEFVYIEDYVLEPPTKCKWVSQIILLGHTGKCTIIPAISYQGNREEEKPNELRIPFIRKTTGNIGGSINVFLTRNRETSEILSLSDEDFEFIKEHWNDMGNLERFYWLMDKGLYKRFYNIKGIEENKNMKKLMMKGNKDKAAFRRTKRWIEFSKKLREEAKGICSCCGTKSRTLQVHHMKPDEYDNLNPDLFVVVCRACHSEVERLARIKPCNWIKYNPDWVAFYSKFILT